MLSIRVLGPLEVSVDGRAVAVGAPRLRTLLAALALTPDRAASIDRLTTAVWDDEPPADARRAVQLYVTRLRRLLGTAAIETADAGYRLRIEPDQVDAVRMTRLLDAAAEQPPDERALLVAAEALWRATPFEGLRSPWLAGVAETLTERHLAGLERRIDLDLDASDPAEFGELVAALRELTARHPLRERLWGQLMVALYRGGRQADALATYARVRDLLDAELAVEPGPALRDLHRRLLVADPALVPAPYVLPVPRQLPAGVGDFVGRGESLDQLDTLLPPDLDGPPAAVIVGTAGVGKTTLAVRWGHRVAKQFDDGQLFVDLLGFDGAEQVVTPEEALGGFLGALGVSRHRMPAGSRARSDLFRSLTPEKRMLVVVDNAQDADQVRPLLPGGPGCRAVVTSRNSLAGLVAAEGARAVVLDVLAVDEALAFLSARLGPGRIAREPAAANDIVEHCARLPLALALVAARSATQPRLPLAAFATDLCEARGRLDALGDVFSWSVRALSPAAARLFRLLGRHPGPDVSAGAASALAGGPADAALGELTDANLIAMPATGRYAMHDLLHAYAASLAGRDPAAERRLVTHYVDGAEAADRSLHEGRISPAYDRAMSWFSAEHRVLVRVVPAAADIGLDLAVCRLAKALVRFLELGGHSGDLLDVQRSGLAAAVRLDDLPRRAVDIGERSGDTHALAVTWDSIGYAHHHLGEYGAAVAAYRKALDLLAELGGRRVASVVLTHLGDAHVAREDLVAARGAWREALTILDGIGHPDADDVRERLRSMVG